jgi:homoaconitase/3-isopropylmalate dehydratase large subunit
MIVTPGTQMILREATKMGYIDILVDAGAVVSNPTFALIYFDCSNTSSEFR